MKKLVLATAGILALAGGGLASAQRGAPAPPQNLPLAQRSRSCEGAAVARRA
jgi:hypothetical protein